jgi:hypothetical protein
MIALSDPTAFQPFTIVTGSGARFHVPHADFIDIPPLPEDEESPSYVTVYTTGPAAVARFIVLSNIQEIEFQMEDGEKTRL